MLVRRLIFGKEAVATGKIVDDYSEMTLIDNSILAQIEPEWNIYTYPIVHRRSSNAPYWQ